MFHQIRKTKNKTMENQTIEQTQKQIEMTKEIQSLLLKLYISENSDFAKQEFKSIDEKLSTYENFKINKLTTLQNKN